MFRIVQVNLDKSELATQELRLYCDKEKVDIDCLHEPYINKGRLIGMRTDATVLVPEDLNPMVAVPILNKKINVLVDTQNTCTWIQVIRIQLNSKIITLVNMYCQFSISVNVFGSRLEEILAGNLGENILVLGDFNAKSPLWYCPRTDENGEKYKDIINQYNLTVHNIADQPPTFQGRAGAESNIDVTMSKDNLHQ